MELGLRLCDQRNPLLEDNPPCSDEPIKDDAGEGVGSKLRSETEDGQLLDQDQDLFQEVDELEKQQLEEEDHEEEEEEEEDNHQHGKEDHGRISGCSVDPPAGPGPGPLQLNLLPHTPVLVAAPAALSPSENSGGGSPPLQMELGISLSNNYGNSSQIRASSSNDNEEYHDNSSSSRKKLRLSKEQSVLLEDSFKEHHSLNPKEKQALAKQLNLRPRQVEVWFQNKRARTKLKQMEMDSEHLRRWCETLTEENRKLQKELKELRALKTTTTSNSFYTAAATLTMCPSCERVSSSSSTAPSATATATATGGVADVNHPPASSNPKITATGFFLN